MHRKKFSRSAAYRPHWPRLLKGTCQKIFLLNAITLHLSVPTRSHLEFYTFRAQPPIPYQRRAKHAGQCVVEVEGGKVPTRDWFLNLQILTSGGWRCLLASSTT